MATSPAVEMINVDEGKNAPLLHNLKGKAGGYSGAADHIVLHSTEPIDNFVAYLKGCDPGYMVTNAYPGEGLFLMYGSYLKARGAETKHADALSPLDWGWAKGTIDPGLVVPNKEGKTKLKVLNKMLAGVTAILSPQGAAAMAAEKVILKQDYYVILSGTPCVMGLKGTVTRITLAHWPAESKNEVVQLTLGEVAQEMESCASEINQLNQGVGSAFLDHIRNSKEHHTHHDYFRMILHPS
ncbi:hypothetical protein [Streptomyces sp. NPDC058268]|uniref:hypothetical protein n=1 Tax=Streptomyces sp. NPDC058268 TaxID=3346413 RepID=UPI0036ECB064